ncbi:MAG: PSP1 domain-containing protein [Candidatus Promineifilaceae bacterium]
MPATVVGVRFEKLGKLYHFRLLEGGESVQPGDHVIVETRRGRQLGQVIANIEPDQIDRKRGLKAIERKATPRDTVLRQLWQQRELAALITCREKASELGIMNAKFVKAEYSFDGSWLTFMYSTEDKKSDVRPLKRALAHSFDARVELFLIGPRDVAKILGGHGACGGPRCCSTFLTEFSPVSIKMAKEQGISLIPQEISGMCGRLRCCLVYEYEQYIQAKKELPKVGKTVGTPFGEGVVRDVRVLREAVVVEVEGVYHELTREQLEPLEELRAFEKKAAQGCSKHENGGCDCGAKH